MSDGMPNKNLVVLRRTEPMKALRRKDKGATLDQVDCRMCGWHGEVHKGCEQCPKCNATRAASVYRGFEQIVSALRRDRVKRPAVQLELPLICHQTFGL